MRLRVGRNSWHGHFKHEDATKKDMAMKEMEMAKDMMAKKDEAGCMMHTGEAMKDLK